MNVLVSRHSSRLAPLAAISIIFDSFNYIQDSGFFVAASSPAM